MNKVILIGRLGSDAELRNTNGGTSVATFSVATSEKWKDKNGDSQERTEWSKCVLWGKAADGLAQYLTKGKQVGLTGKLQTRQWEDKEGTTRYVTEIVVDHVELLGSKGEGSSGGGGGRRERQEPGFADDDLDAIPF